MDDKLYKINGKMLNKNNYIKEVMLTLENYNYASVEFLSMLLKTDKELLKELLKEGIIDFFKDINNKNMKMTMACKKMKVKSDYVVELIEEGRIEVLNPTPLELEEMKKIEFSAKAENEKLYKLETARKLMAGFDSPKIVISEETKSVGYHSRINTRR